MTRSYWIIQALARRAPTTQTPQLLEFPRLTGKSGTPMARLVAVQRRTDAACPGRGQQSLEVGFWQTRKPGSEAWSPSARPMKIRSAGQQQAVSPRQSAVPSRPTEGVLRVIDLDGRETRRHQVGNRLVPIVEPGMGQRTRCHPPPGSRRWRPGRRRPGAGRRPACPCRDSGRRPRRRSPRSRAPRARAPGAVGRRCRSWPAPARPPPDTPMPIACSRLSMACRRAWRASRVFRGRRAARRWRDR